MEEQRTSHFLVVAKAGIWGIMIIGNTAEDPFQYQPYYGGEIGFDGGAEAG